MDDDIIRALKLITERSPAAASQALAAMRAVAVGSPTASHRYRNAVEIALASASADFSQEERRELLNTLTEITYAPDDRRQYMLRVLLTDDERDTLQARAQAANQTISEYVRSVLFP